jgi:hypothetical protein
VEFLFGFLLSYARGIILDYYMRMKIPIACTLTEAEVQARRRTILESIRRVVRSVRSLPLGYAYHFDPDSGVMAQLARLVDLERTCCSFLTFRIMVDAGKQSICLEITGPPEAKAVIADFFGR